MRREGRARFFLLLFLGLAGSFPAQAQEAQEGAFETFLQNVGQEAALQGVAPDLVSRALQGIVLDETVIALDRKQPEGKISFDRYVRNVVTQGRIDEGRELAANHAAWLRQLEDAYGVPGGVIIALWGIESSYGEWQGDFSVLSSLASLAYEGRRADFFRGELIEALKILQEEGIEPEALTGSWAGAMGQAQFMPSTFRKFAQDGDGDGRRDIWENRADVLASIAHYLAAEGWQGGQSWGQEVLLAKNLAPQGVGLDVSFNMETWKNNGLTGKIKPLPEEEIKASLIQPDGAGGRSFLVYDNFRALMRWNRSTYFATSVGLLADLITNGPQ